MNKCQVENCNNKVYSNGYCQKHYTRLRRHGSVDIVKPSGKSKSERPNFCTMCGDKVFGKGLCQKHYMEKYRRGNLPLNGSVKLNLSEEIETVILKIMDERDMTAQEACVLLLEIGIKSLKGE